MEVETNPRARGLVRAHAVKSISDQFELGKTVQHLQKMMEDVTSKEVSAQTVNAACNCVQQLNETIKTVIKAAKFLADD